MAQGNEGLGIAIIVFGGLLLLSKGAKAVVSPLPTPHDPGLPEPDFTVPNITGQGGYLNSNRQPEPVPFVDYGADISRGSYQPVPLTWPSPEGRELVWDPNATIDANGYPTNGAGAWVVPGRVSQPIPQPEPSLRFDDWRNILAPYYPSLDLMSITITMGIPPLIGRGSKGMTVLDNVYIDPAWWNTLSDGQKLSVVAHELVHVRQWKDRGVLFLLDYLSQSFRPHDDKTFEAEAISQEKFIAGQLGLPYVSG